MDAIRSRNAVLVWTDTSLHALQFVGAPFTFSLSQIGANCGAVSNTLLLMSTVRLFGCHKILSINLMVLFLKCLVVYKIMFLKILILHNQKHMQPLTQSLMK